MVTVSRQFVACPALEERLTVGGLVVSCVPVVVLVEPPPAAAWCWCPPLVAAAWCWCPRASSCVV